MCLHLTLMSFRSIPVLPVLDTFVLIFIRLDALTFHANTVQIFEEEKTYWIVLTNIFSHKKIATRCVSAVHC